MLLMRPAAARAPSSLHQHQEKTPPAATAAAEETMMQEQADLPTAVAAPARQVRLQLLLKAGSASLAWRHGPCWAVARRRGEVA